LSAPVASGALGQTLTEFADDGAAIALYARNPANGQSVAHGESTPFFAAELSRLLPVIAYLEGQAAGTLMADEPVTVAAEYLRGQGLRSEDIGVSLALGTLARRTLLDNDRTAEAMLVARLGGAESIEETARQWNIPGLGGYLEPCERDRAYAAGLDPRFEAVDCDGLGTYLHRDDASGLSPLPFEDPPVFDEPTRSAAAARVAAIPRGRVTARAWAQLLSRLTHRTLNGGLADGQLVDWLDDGLASEGGGDAVPGSAWVGAIGSVGYGGTHWIGRVRRGQDVFVGALLTGERQSNVTRFLGDAVGLAWQVVMGNREAWPPVPLAPRSGFHSAWVLSGEAAQSCDAALAQFEDQLACRSDAASGSFAAHDRTSVSVLLQDPPDLEIAWFWSDPDGRRRRFQRRFAAGPWWVATRGFRPLTPGDWQAVVYVNGDPLANIPFAVH
jgi:hypothetical protein